MTTSGQQTTSSTGPLDLRTKRRHGKVIEETGVNPSESEKASSHNGNSMDNGKVKVGEMFVHSQGGPGHRNGTRKAAIEIQHPSRSTAVTTTDERTVKTDLYQENNDCAMTFDPSPASLSRTLHLAPVKCETGSRTAVDCDAKTMGQTVSKLPFRKRPFPAGQEMYSPSRTPLESECPQTSKDTQDEESITAKSSKRSAPEGIGIRPHVQPAPMNGQADRRLAIDPYQHLSAIAPYSK